MEDYTGGPAAWAGVGWCADLDRARELADALVAWDGGLTRAQACNHSDAVGHGWPHEGAWLVYQVDAGADRPPRPRCPDKGPNRYRPVGLGPELAAEPEWQSWLTAPGWLRHPPTYALHVWAPDTAGPGGQWHTVAWCEGGRMGAGHAAAALRVGIEGGPYPQGDDRPAPPERLLAGPHAGRAVHHRLLPEVPALGRTAAALPVVSPFTRSRACWIVSGSVSLMMKSSRVMSVITK
ncbi:hypothetical protein FXF51_26240 [Nonomuraea sp. PA05]|nr:hypothetical protein FXF51_26240 [Nonomuraea sp. PA05]